MPRNDKWVVSEVVQTFNTREQALEFMEERVADARERFVNTGKWGSVDLVLSTYFVTAKVVRDPKLSGTLSEYYLCDHPPMELKEKENERDSPRSSQADEE